MDYLNLALLRQVVIHDNDWGYGDDILCLGCYRWFQCAIIIIMVVREILFFAIVVCFICWGAISLLGVGL